MALQAKQGLVCAVERREIAAALLGQNRNRFALENLQVVCGSAPEACVGLSAPLHAFIGGSAGNMHEIVAVLLAKNPHVRIVATAVSLESVAELTDCLDGVPLCGDGGGVPASSAGQKSRKLPPDERTKSHLYFYDAGRRENGMMWSLAALVIGFCIDLLVGDHHGFPHPVVLIGNCISVLERGLRCICPQNALRRAGGGRHPVGSGGRRIHRRPGSAAVAERSGQPVAALALESVMCWQILAVKFLRDESMKVYDALESGDLAASLLLYSFGYAASRY